MIISNSATVYLVSCERSDFFYILILILARIKTIYKQMNAYYLNRYFPFCDKFTEFLFWAEVYFIHRRFFIILSTFHILDRSDMLLSMI